MLKSFHLAAMKCFKTSILTELMRRNNLQVICALRKLSSSSSSAVDASNDDIILDLDSKTGIAVMKWNRKRVNSFSLAFAEQNIEILKKLESDKSCRGLVLTSAIPNIFSAGFDLFEMITYLSDRKRTKRHIRAIGNLVTTLRLTDLPIVAAVNGTALAGGCIMAGACDYRVMIATKGEIGVSEVKLGISVSSTVTSMFTNLMGHHKAELALLNGTRFKPSEALEVGMVDELADDEDDLLQKSISKALEFASVPRYARGIVKSAFVDRKDYEMTETQVEMTLKMFASDEALANINEMFAHKKKN